MSRLPIAAVMTLWICFAPFANGEVKLSGVFGDHMVLQRSKPCPVWGSGKPGEVVTVSFGGQRHETKVDPQGRWQVDLTAMEANAKPQSLTVSGGNEVVINDVLVGDVWLCAGQSNMAFPLKKTSLGRELKDQPDQPLIRLFRAKTHYSIKPMDTVSATWRLCSAEVASDYSAVAYHFGQHLAKETGVPIGLMTVAYGGTAIEAWLPATSFSKLDSLKPQAAAVQALDPAEKPTYRTLTGIYNGMIHPLGPTAVRGMLWYQGETNCLNGDTDVYAEKMKELVDVWRGQFKQPDMPFYFVMLPPYTYTKAPEGWAKAEMTEESLPRFWEAQRRCLSLISNSGMVVVSDTVRGANRVNNIHPRQKDVVGYRLAQLALAKEYGRADVEYSGPVYRSMKVEGNKIVLQFDHARGLAAARKGPLSDFVIAGEDRKFVPAKATIVGETIEVSSEQVPAPVAVRYAWRETAVGNLINAAEIPAAPFRTDGW